LDRAEVACSAIATESIPTHRPIGRGQGPASRRAWLGQNAPLLLLGAALVAAAGLLLALANGLTFFQDTWEFLINRRAFTADAILAPHNEHIVVVPVLLEQLLLTLFGMTSAAPEYVLLIVALLVTATLLFVYARRRVGPWPALMATVLLLFLGPAWQDILWPFELGFVGSLLFGLAMLLALDRDDRNGDIAACVFLIVSAGFSSLGLSFMVAAAVNVLQCRRSRGLRRAYVVAVPVALFAVWYLGWGHDAESHVTLRNVLSSPPFVLEGLAASVESLLGLSKAPIEGVATVGWGQPLLVALIALVVYGQWRRPGFSAGFWVVAAATATNWFLAAFNYIPGREPTAGRYMYAGGAFVLLLAVELLRSVRIGRNALLIAGAVTIAAVASNLVPLKDGRDWLQSQTVLTKSDLAAIEISRRTVDPNFALTPEIAGTPSLIDIQAGKYLEAEAEYGSPAYTPGELVNAPEVGRRQADIVLSQALPLSTETYVGAKPNPEGSCTTVPGGVEAPAVRLSPGVTRIEVPPGPSASFSLRRFAASGYPVPTEGAPGGSTTLMTIPRDASTRPWYLHVDAPQPVNICY
jgi:hypothetical protein